MQPIEQLTELNLSQVPSQPQVNSNTSEVSWETIQDCLNSSDLYQDKLQKLKVLLDPQKNRMAKTGEALCKAIQAKIDLKSFELLVQAGCPVNIAKEDLTDKTYFRLPIEFAISNNRFDILKFMIEQAGVEFVDLVHDNITPLMLALKARQKFITEKSLNELGSNYFIIAYLLEKGINLYKTLPEPNDASGLSLAVDGCMVDMVELILRSMKQSEVHLKDLARIEREGINSRKMSGAWGEALAKLLYCSPDFQQRYLEIIRIFFRNGVKHEFLLKLGTKESRAKLLDLFITLGENEYANIILPEFAKNKDDLSCRIIPAAKHNNITILQQLLKLIDVSNHDSIANYPDAILCCTAIEEAAANGSLDAVKYLLTIPVIRISNSTFYFAAERGHVKIFEVLVKQFKSDRSLAYRGDQRQETLKYLFDAFRASRDNPEIAKVIINEGGFSVQELLFFACKEDARRAAICLIGHLNANAESIDGKGTSALHYALETEKYDLVTALLHTKVNVEVFNQNGDSFFKACLKQLIKVMGQVLHEEKVQKLIKALDIFAQLLT